VQQALQQRLALVEDRIQSAFRRAGRRRDEVTLVAVTKSVTPEVAASLHRLGLVDLAESRPQELWRKAAALPTSVRWHLVGHLQRNKIERTLPLAHLIHSVDSLRLLKALDAEAARTDHPVSVLLQVNASREAVKHGFAAEELPAVLREVSSLKKVTVCGLMTMAALEDDPERCRPTFAALRDLRDRFAHDLPPPHTLNHLSMGMSNDFEVAVEEGATLIRLGTALFEAIGGESS